MPCYLALVIHELRGHRVILDSDLARIYGVEKRALVQAGGETPRGSLPTLHFN